MRIASPSLPSFRAIFRVLLAAVVVAIGIVAAGFIHPDHTRPPIRSSPLCTDHLRAAPGH